MASARFILLTVVVALIVAVSFAQPTSRILGGEEAGTNDFPYAVSVRLDGAHICGGTIIGNKYILTAAHNVKYDAKRLSVRVGSTNQFAGGQIAYVSAVTIHPDNDDLKNDLAILTVEKDFVWTERIKKLDIATTSAEEPSVNDEVIVAGWGEQSSGASPFKLQYTSFTVATEEACKDGYSGSDETTICLAHNNKHGSCRGDAGNGAEYNDKLVAVSSFVVGACGAIYPDVFVKVAPYADWINSNTV